MQLFKIIKFLLIFILLSVKSVHAQNKISINKIFNTYQSNVAKFDEKYKGKSVEIVATFNRIIGLNESLNYKEASRKRWGYLSEFSMNSKKIICFSENSSDASYSEPNKIAYVQGNLSDIDDGKMIITNCYVGDPKYATINSNISAEKLLSQAMMCDKDFSPEYIIKKLLDERFIDPTPLNALSEGEKYYLVIKPLKYYDLQIKYIIAYDNTFFFDENSIFQRNIGMLGSPFMEIVFEPQKQNREIDILKNIIPIDKTNLGNCRKNCGIDVKTKKISLSLSANKEIKGDVLYDVIEKNIDDKRVNSRNAQSKIILSCRLSGFHEYYLITEN